MRLIQFNDTCVIKRRTGKDQYDNPVVETVYGGNCLYQEESVIVSQGVTIYRATLYIQGKTDARTNDLVQVTDSYGNQVSSIIGNIDIVSMPITKEVISKIELKQGVS